MEIDLFASLVNSANTANALVLEFGKTRRTELLDELRDLKLPCLQAAEALGMALQVASHSAEQDLQENLKPVIKHLFGLAGSEAYITLGGISLHLKEYAEAWDQYEKGRDLAKQIGAVAVMVMAINNMGWVAFEQGDFGVALELFQEAKSHFVRLPPDAEIRANVNTNIQLTEARLSNL